MLIISAVGLFCCDKVEEIPNEKVVNMSKLTKSYFTQYIKQLESADDRATSYISSKNSLKLPLNF